MQAVKTLFKNTIRPNIFSSKSHNYYKPIRNFTTNLIINNNKDSELFFDQILKEIKSFDKITDEQTHNKTDQEIYSKIHSQINLLDNIYTYSLPLELKKQQVILQSVFRGMLVNKPLHYETTLNNFIDTVDMNRSDRVKELTFKQLQQADSVKDLLQSNDWFKQYLKEELNSNNEKSIYKEFSSLFVNLDNIVANIGYLNNILQENFEKESTEMRLIIGFYFITYYLAGVELFGDSLKNGGEFADNEFIQNLVDDINDYLNIYNMSKNDLDLNYKIKDFELLDKDITLQSCVDCLQFLNLLFKSIGNNNSIQEALIKYKEKHQSNHIFSFIYSIVLYYTNNKQEALNILKQLTLLIKENRPLQPTTLPITNWFLKVCVGLNSFNNKEQKDINLLKLALEEASKDYLVVTKIVQFSKTLSDLINGYYLTEDYKNLFMNCFVLLDEFPYLFLEEQLIEALKSFYFSGNKIINSYKTAPMCLSTILTKYAACFPSNVIIQYLFLEFKENMGIIKDKNELKKEYTKLFEMCTIPTEEMKKHKVDMLNLPAMKEEIRKKLIYLQ
ncbi:hypothetical protein ABK040_005647 [Willaertia magna]